MPEFNYFAMGYELAGLALAFVVLYFLLVLILLSNLRRARESENKR